jgi:hypothetical protein
VRGARGGERGGGDEVLGRRDRELVEHALQQARVLLARAHVVALQQRAGERGVRRDPEQLELRQRAVEAPERGRAVGPVGDDLREHRVVARSDRRPLRAPEATRTPGPTGST